MFDLVLFSGISNVTEGAEQQQVDGSRRGGDGVPNWLTGVVLPDS